MSFCFSVFLIFCLPVNLSTCLPVYLSSCLAVYLSTCIPVYLSICLPVYLYLSTYLPFYLSTFLPVYHSTCPFCISCLFPSFLFVYIPTCLGSLCRCRIISSVIEFSPSRFKIFKYRNLQI